LVLLLKRWRNVFCGATETALIALEELPIPVLKRSRKVLMTTHQKSCHMGFASKRCSATLTQHVTVTIIGLLDCHEPTAAAMST
jgi:hypothetical protein